MRVFKSLCLTFSVLLLGSFASTPAQPAASDAEKLKKIKELDERVVRMLDQSISDANGLKLAQNRAVVFAMVGDLYWKFDQKRSRELFRAAAGEIVTYNHDAEKEKRESAEAGAPEVFDPGDPRTEVLQLIAMRDANLALDLLAPTRSSMLVAAMAKAPAIEIGAVGSGTASGTVSGFGSMPVDPTAAMERARVSQELMMEERFKTMAAASDPERAVKTLKESLAKGISYSLVSLLQAIHRGDEKRSAELAADVVAKLVETDLAKNVGDLNGAVGLLQFVSRPVAANPNPNVKIFTFSELQAKDIANKLAATFLQGAASPALSSALSRSIPAFEKVLPEKLLLLKQRDAQNKRSQNSSARQGPARFYDLSTSPEDLLAQAAKLSTERERTMAYQAVASRISSITDDARARKLIEQIGDERIRTSAAQQYESTRIGRLTAAEKLEESHRAIAALTDRKAKVQRLVALAAQYHRRGGELNLESAKSIMAEAKAMTNPFPEDEDETANLMEVVKGYAVIEPETAFRLIEPVVDQFNELIQAAAVMSKYNRRDRSFKKGELFMRTGMNSGGGLLPFRYVQHMQMLGRADLERMSTLVDRFQRSDARTIFRLHILQGYLRGPQIMPFPAGGYLMVS